MSFSNWSFPTTSGTTSGTSWGNWGNWSNWSAKTDSSESQAFNEEEYKSFREHIIVIYKHYLPDFDETKPKKEEAFRELYNLGKRLESDTKSNSWSNWGDTKSSSWGSWGNWGKK